MASPIDSTLPGRVEVSATPWPLRVLRTVRHRGWRYAVHRSLRRLPGLEMTWRRRLLYGQPRTYWTLRGGADYFLEQEGQEGRHWRSTWLAERLASYRPTSVLEIGCGYGKQLSALASVLPEAVRLVGVDFSPTQLALARSYLDRRGRESTRLVLADGQYLPFDDDSFDLVFTSAVILHNDDRAAERIRLEALRVARRLVAHNEDTNVSYNRYGYDTADWYRQHGIPLAEVTTIPVPESLDELAQHSQFCVARP